jgi:hypothetical protein
MAPWRTVTRVPPTYLERPATNCGRRKPRHLRPKRNQPSGVAPDSKPANEVPPTPSARRPRPQPTASACEPFRDFIELALSKGGNAKAIYQDLVESSGLHWPISKTPRDSFANCAARPQARGPYLDLMLQHLDLMLQPARDRWRTVRRLRSGA